MSDRNSDPDHKTTEPVSPRDTSLDGIHFMLPTPFDADGELSLPAFHRLVGCAGVVTLGVMGESHRLSDAERSLVMNTVIKAADGRLKVVVGVSSQSGRHVAERAKRGRRRGIERYHALDWRSPTSVR
jgi:dihydrodipicolinate synthase/N-acetylneuraminate lyase